MKKFSVVLFLAVLAILPAEAQLSKHALAKVGKVAVTPVVHPAFFTKATLGSVLFLVENGVDVAHLSLSIADKGFSAASADGKVPILDNISAFVGVADKDSGKLDSWLEKQEMYLFGTSN